MLMLILRCLLVVFTLLLTLLTVAELALVVLLQLKVFVSAADIFARR